MDRNDPEVRQSLCSLSYHGQRECAWRTPWGAVPPPWLQGGGNTSQGLEDGWDSIRREEKDSKLAEWSEPRCRNRNAAFGRNREEPDSVEMTAVKE